MNGRVTDEQIGDRTGKSGPAEVKGHIALDAGNWALVHKHSGFNNTTEHVCSATTPISLVYEGIHCPRVGTSACASPGSILQPQVYKAHIKPCLIL